MRRGKSQGWLILAIVILKPLLTVLTRRRWRGQEHIPRTGGALLCTNHISHADPFTFAHFVYGAGRIPRFLAKEEIFRLPFAGRVASGAGQIPVYRESGDAQQALRAAVAAVESGEVVCIYPEATLTRDPGLWPMGGKTGAARVALATGVPVLPVAQWGAQDLLAPYSARVRPWPRPTVTIVAGPPLAFDDLREQPVTADLLRVATDRILDAITVLLAEIRGESPPPTRLDPRSGELPRTGNPRMGARLRRRGSA